ncbi:wax ester/triacylglycerol synthase family O-acyltransferase [Pikeienuella sp. HZG-20]|uniref:WS/DGAT/MGAT family O-acyltransferase n=1 Tax=Paludibacillus litoralis TaxID=3133267 RepID=UPI0030EB6370
MNRLSGIDASFLYLETPETPMHIGLLALFDPPEGLSGSFHAHFKQFFAGRVHLIPIFGRKLAAPIFALDHPGWVDAGELDLDWHIEARRVPAPGGRAELEALVGALHSEPLDRSRPLWRFTVIEGLASGQVALYSKAHHAAIDDGAGTAVADALFDLTATPRAAPPPEPKPAPRRLSPAERALLGFQDMAGTLFRQQLNLMTAAPMAAGRIADLLAPAFSGEGAAAAVPAPKTPFGGAIGQARSYAARSVSLPEAKAVAEASKVKLNDVAMAVSSGALRRYLSEMDQLSEQSLVAFAPVAMREVGAAGLSSQAFGMTCALATECDDPVERLMRIHAGARVSKMMAGGVKEIPPSAYTVFGPPMLLPGLMQLYHRTGLAQFMPDLANVVVSNTAGPPAPLYCAGAKATALYPVSVPMHGVGLNITAQSYCDSLAFGVTADRASVPDAGRLGDCLVMAFEELRAAVLGARKRPAAPRRIARPAPPPPRRAKPVAEPAASSPEKTKRKKAPTEKPAAKAPAKPRAGASRRPAAPRRPRKRPPKPDDGS